MANFGAPFNKIVKEGILRKVSEDLGSNNDRYVILGERRIAYYIGTNVKKLTLNGEFYLRRESIVNPFSLGANNGFQIDVNDEKESIYRFLCPKDEADQWIDTIRSVIGKLKSLPDSMYFIPKLKPMTPTLGNFPIPYDFPQIVIDIKKGERADINVNKDIFRPEDLVPIVDVRRINSIQYPFPVILPNQIECMQYKWGDAILKYLQFTYQFGGFALKVHDFMNALWNSPNGKVKKNLRIDRDECTDLYSQIISLLNDTCYAFKENKIDSHAEAMNLKPLWNRFSKRSSAENTLTKWFEPLFVFFNMIDNAYSGHGYYISHQIMSCFDDALKIFKNFKEQMINEVENGLTYAQLSQKILEILPFLFPQVEIPSILNGYNPVFSAIMPVNIIIIIKYFQFFVIPDVIDSKCGNKDVYNYFSKMQNTVDKFLADLRIEIDDYYVKVISKCSNKSLIPSLLISYKQSVPNSTQKEVDDLLQKMLENAPDAPFNFAQFPTPG